jgi:hypothetical protein
MRAALIALQIWVVLFLALHDWVPLGRLTNRAAVRGVDSTAKLVWTTIWSTALYAFGLACCLWYAPWPAWLRLYLAVSYWVLLGGALLSWWVPYLFGASEEKKARFRERFAGTLAFLPERHGIRPDTLHVVFHASLVAFLVLMRHR